MDRYVRVALTLGLGAIMVAIVMIATDAVEGPYLPTVIAVASAMLFFAIFRALLTRRGEVYKDERTQKIHNSALAISWWFAYVVMAVAYLLSAGEIVRISLENFVPLMFLVMLGSYWAAKLYLSHKGG